MAVPNSITQTNLEFGGLAVVVDSSVALAGNWLTILRYLGMFVQRLSQINYGLGYRIAWVTYGPPDSSPSSLLCKRFFAEIVDVTNLIKVPDELYQLGIGTTHCGGTRGMAMLEGLVAAVELFDTLNSLSEVPRRSPSHILHVTASFPDNTKHPQANMSPSLDEITWESLPGELSKRNILLSSIVLNPKNNTKIPEIHSSVTLNTAPISWLTVDAPHVAYVVSLSLSQKGVKRPGDQINNAEQPPEKRHQSNVPSLSPPRNKPNTNVNVNPSSAPIPNSSKPPSLGLSGPPQPKPSGASDQPPAGQPSQLMPPNLANLPPLNSTQKIPWPGIGNLTPTELLQRWRQLEEMRRRTDAVLGQAMNNGETAKAETVKQQIAQWEPMLQRFRTMANSYLNALKRAGMAGAQILNAMTSSLGQPQASSSTSSTGGSTGNIHPNLNNPDPSSQPQTTQSNPNSSSSSNTNISLPATKPNDGTSAATDSSSTLVPSAASTSTKPSPKSVPRPSPKLPTVKPSPKSKLKASPIKHAASNASNASSTSSTIASSSNASLVTSTNSTAVPGTTSGVPISSNSNLPPEAALQMQKLMEQGGRGHPRDMAMGSMGQASPSLTAAGVTPQSQLQAQGMQGILPGQGQSGQQSQVGGVVGTGAGAIIGGPPGFSAPNVPTPATSAGVQGQNDGIPAWTGIFSYSGEGGVTTRKISVMAMSANHLEWQVIHFLSWFNFCCCLASLFIFRRLCLFFSLTSFVNFG
ncbi:hypothetical protein J3R30DRAFT_2579843 [Lentinula aciculospora]|uniref:Mediator of RNA polymerase II transcription subunit 25 n=1 Tax=Lentinula aciculospora TaxID=153920 RepID=A0A9W9ADB6_9AGAR|nr:hypothetical protein J3R30DRAFT_2579843 [Lentinula aciculospora]